MTGFSITRRIEIDAGHRIREHGSKCRHLHGHRYVIEATCGSVGGALHESGEQRGMVLDFGFLKEEMLRLIDLPCDHGFLVAADDADLLATLAPADVEPTAWMAGLLEQVQRQGYCETRHNRLDTKLYLIAGSPTAEVLARHWFERLAPVVRERSGGFAALVELAVHETPNCIARYRP